jgi:glucose-6-phosphate dehydrogenase assembly protein OpcA
VSFTPGLPVEIGSIERALGHLWEESGESKTRASLINLALYSEEEGSLERNNSIIHGIAREHAMRSLLIQADPTRLGSSAEAWINMNCYLRGAQGGEVCSEQISFLLGGEAARSLQSVVFSHLDSDLPLILWWQADFSHPIDGKLWRWVDRLLFDSQQWKYPKEQLELIGKIAAITESRTILCDLNWTRTFHIRQAVAGMFDSTATLPELQALQSLQITHAPEYRTTALLLLGWLADRLGWQLTLGGENPQFQNSRGGLLSVSLLVSSGTSIGSMTLSSSTATFEVLRATDSNFYITTAEGSSFTTTRRILRAPSEKTCELLLGELARRGSHALYQRAVQAVKPLWEEIV